MTEKMIRCFGAGVRHVNHALKVFATAGCIIQRGNLSKDEIRSVELTSLRHDIGIREAI